MSAGGSWKDLFKAAEENDIPKAQYHLDLGVDPNFQHPEYFTSPLFEAIRGGHLEFVKILVEEGKANPSLVEELTDDSAVEVAISAREFGIRDYLNARLPSSEQYSPHSVLVTTTGRGHNLAIAKQICKSFLVKGHEVVLAGIRHKEDTTLIPGELLIDTKNPSMRCIEGSLATIPGILALAESVARSTPGLNTLVHNANVWATELVRNETDGLERSFCVNYMARSVLTNALMPVLQRNKDSRVIHLVPTNNADNAAMTPPCPTATPTGTDFSWWKQGSSGIACCEVAFFTTSRKATDTPVAVLMIRAGGTWNALSPTTLSASSSSSCWDCLWRVVRKLGQNDPVALVASLESILAADPMEFPRMDGRIFDCGKNSVTETAAITSTTNTLLTEWEEWTADCLARQQKKILTNDKLS
jgi:NAD(P)-dependent dehydrogenase (short-subunit alcohol dehydrogenase family)